jgi:hypothetical protein
LLYKIGTICFFGCMFFCCPKKIRRKYKFFKLKQMLPNIKQMFFCFIMGLGFSVFIYIISFLFKEQD